MKVSLKLYRQKILWRKVTSLVLAVGMIGCMGIFSGQKLKADDSITPTVPGLDVFALKSELQCSWGATRLDSNGELEPYGDATNQRLYLGHHYAQGGPGDLYLYPGSAEYGYPLEWWICGRLASTNNPDDWTTDPNGDAAILCMASRMDGFQFNDSDSDYSSGNIENKVEPYFDGPQPANHYGLSSIRATINRGLFGPGPLGKTGLMSTAGIPDADASFFETKHFTGGELGLLCPSTVQTVTYGIGGGSEQTYETTDRLYLPSGVGMWHEGGDEPFAGICWGYHDPSNIDGVDNLETSFDVSKRNAIIASLIPSNYFTRVTNRRNGWIRSADHGHGGAFGITDATDKGLAWGARVTDWHMANLCCRIDLSNVLFASTAFGAIIDDEPILFEDLNTPYSWYEEEKERPPAMFMRFQDTLSPVPTPTMKNGKISNGKKGDTIVVQGAFEEDGDTKNWAYSYTLEDDDDGISLQDIWNEIDSSSDDILQDCYKDRITSLGICQIWAEHLGDDGLIPNQTPS